MHALDVRDLANAPSTTPFGKVLAVMPSHRNIRGVRWSNSELMDALIAALREVGYRHHSVWVQKRTTVKVRAGLLRGSYLASQADGFNGPFEAWILSKDHWLQSPRRPEHVAVLPHGGIALARREDGMFVAEASDWDVGFEMSGWGTVRQVEQLLGHTPEYLWHDIAVTAGLDAGWAILAYHQLENLGLIPWRPLADRVYGSGR